MKAQNLARFGAWFVALFLFKDPGLPTGVFLRLFSVATD